MNIISPDNPDSTLEQLLDRADIWRGQSRGVATQAVIGTGYTSVDAALLNGGWPTRSLIEVCQRGFQQQEWCVFGPVLKNSRRHIVLLNPPAMPFGQALIQAGLDLERIIVVQVANKADFLASFVELARTESCEIVLAWQLQHYLSYTELRKCLLAANENPGLCVLFRPDITQQQNSPATLRLLSAISATDIVLTIFKQKGAVQKHPSGPITLPLPGAWKGLLPYHLLDQALPDKPERSSDKRKSAVLIPLSRGKR